MHQSLNPPGAHKIKCSCRLMVNVLWCLCFEELWKSTQQEEDRNKAEKRTSMPVQHCLRINWQKPVNHVDKFFLKQLPLHSPATSFLKSSKRNLQYLRKTASAVTKRQGGLTFKRRGQLLLRTLQVGWGGRTGRMQLECCLNSWRKTEASVDRRWLKKTKDPCPQGSRLAHKCSHKCESAFDHCLLLAFSSFPKSPWMWWRGSEGSLKRNG